MTDVLTSDGSKLPLTLALAGTVESGAVGAKKIWPYSAEAQPRSVRARAAARDACDAARSVRAGSAWANSVSAQAKRAVWDRGGAGCPSMFHSSTTAPTVQCTAQYAVQCTVQCVAEGTAQCTV